MTWINYSLESLVILLIFALQVVFILYLKRASFKQVTTPAEKSKVDRFWYGIAVATTLFLVGITAMSRAGFFSVESLPPRFPLILIPHFLFMFWLLSLKISGPLAFLHRIPAAFLVAVQFYRFVLEFVILALYQQGLVPLQITYEGRSFDLWVGLSSLIVGLLLSKKVKWVDQIAIAFHIFGFASLLNIVFTAATSFPSPFRLYDTNYLPTFFPGILIPAFIAPFAFYMHILSLKQLIYQQRYAKSSTIKANS